MVRRYLFSVEVLYHVERIIKPHIDRRECCKLSQCASNSPRCDSFPLPVLWQFQLCHIQKGIYIPGKHAGSRGAIHRALPALISLAMVMAIYHRTVTCIGNLIKIINELCHCISVILVAGKYFVDRIDDYGCIAPILCPADQ